MALAGALGGLLMPATLAEVEGDRLFSLKIYPVLKAKCFACHGEDPENVEGDLNLLSREGMLKGGESSVRVLVEGHPEESDLYRAITWEEAGLEMPPKENDRLSSGQIADFRNWIKAGAPWPDEAKRRKYTDEERAMAVTAEGEILKTSGGQSEEWTYRRYLPEDLWSLRPVVRGGVSDGQHPVDFFIDSRRRDAGFSAAPEADPRVLIRRATYDLLGLPPEPSQVVRFLDDWELDSGKAWSTLIDRLLESPHYGERWAQHWLDVARYADTGGYSNDYERSNAWRYRDYVIRSFNRDKPYNQFVTEQLAGDQLADQSVKKRLGKEGEALHKVRLRGEYNEEESEWLMATGFLRMGPWDSAMVKAPEARQIYLDDVVNSVGQTFLATNLRCAKCHDHKFDPIPTRDYYRIYAAFAGTQMAERRVPFMDAENLRGFKEGQTQVRRLLSFAAERKNVLLSKQEDAARRWFSEKELPYLAPQKRRSLPDEKKPPRHVGLDHAEQGRLKVREQDERIWTRRMERYEPLIQGVYDGPDPPEKMNLALKMRIADKVDRGWLPESVIYSGGSLEAPGETVSPGVLSGCGVPVKGGGADDPYRIGDHLGGRRLALARWIVDPRNPLTARVIVNRIWQHHFGKGIAGNSNNFGAKGEKPTHPLLLDWLAADFVENGWTFKRLHRLIMNSRAYRQSGSHPSIKVLREKDPDNHLLARFAPRRLTAEELRDTLLFASGELRSELGGVPVLPEINQEVALAPRMIQFSIAPAWQPSRRPAERNRRTIYTYRVRGLPDPFLDLFNRPSPNESCEERHSAAVTPQAFALLNSDVMTDRSIALALRLKHEEVGLAGQIELAFQLVLGRSPDSMEQKRLQRYVNDMKVYHREQVAPKGSYPTKITRSLVEEFSGKTFSYEEILPVYEDYTPDRKPGEVSPVVRGLADLALLLFNSNEFLYVY